MSAPTEPLLAAARSAGADPLSSANEISSGREQRQRSAVIAIAAILFSRVAQNGFSPLLSELLLSRACVSLGLPAYPAKLCERSHAASALAAVRSSYFNLAMTIPGIAAVGFFAMLADARGRKVSLVMCYLSQLLQYALIWLLPAGRVCLGGLCVDDSFWILLTFTAVLSALGGDSLSLSLAAVADATEGPGASGRRSMLFGLVEAVNMGGEWSRPRRPHPLPLCFAKSSECVGHLLEQLQAQCLALWRQVTWPSTLGCSKASC